MSKVVDLHHRNRPIEQAPQIHHDMERAVQQIQNTHAEMVGFVVFAIDKSGEWSTRHSIRGADIMGPRMLAGVAIEGIREMLVTDKAISEALEG
ncbi:MAG: hypothetical protein ACYDD1_04925 [Caulobacteraceae bacterium]